MSGWRVVLLAFPSHWSLGFDDCQSGSGGGLFIPEAFDHNIIGAGALKFRPQLIPGGGVMSVFANMSGKAENAGANIGRGGVHGWGLGWASVFFRFMTLFSAGFYPAMAAPPILQAPAG